MEMINEDKLFKQCKDYWKEHEIELRIMCRMNSFDQYFATIKKQFDIYRSLPDAEKKKFRDSHMMMIEKNFRQRTTAIRHIKERE